ncbi:XTP/dITP diphosphatase [Heyndrickxia ginsengihumi]|uniref:dITP/XTP pyrophosphatase n=1 Tax=Heyndrickxia ginsengihumi TaxID=363870 RepID=A0A0A6Y3V1_9BACI|nr:XTP/dITP diphosphatase [Heyndrickxia ginsengihumi]KHD86927.1 nucleoside-triphosphate diphosphatase [Heyndrickxia ginsengihumi]MBE6182743.1 XTP/dITP diphosphatase [Bacillus sp. (in: firmicutes)]MCM3021944.1 XTP/dITP diphosphatase [Heyndrickxia ginsengihumi]NEY20859.1 XTP/dITP diphosphatase [Heyndrickxia ginsengihumi]
MKAVLIATKNRGKAKEFEQMFSKYGIEVKTLLDVDHAIDVAETGKTFEENAILKAETIANQYQLMTIADDSGLMIDALDGSPGIYSARYAGEEKNDEANIDKVLSELMNVSDDRRAATFYCALAVAEPGKETYTVSGTLNGMITHKRIGENGFGYDPIFKISSGKTLAQLSSEEKNAISHRANAMKQLSKLLNQKWGEESIK